MGRPRLLLFNEMNKQLLVPLCCCQEDDEDEELEDSDDDDTAALLAELEKIKKERAEEQARKVKSHPLKSICFLQIGVCYNWCALGTWDE